MKTFREHLAEEKAKAADPNDKKEKDEMDSGKDTDNDKKDDTKK